MDALEMESLSMKTHEIVEKLVKELKKNYQYQNGKWLYRETTKWCYCVAPRLKIWDEMLKHKRAGVIPSTLLADDIERCLQSLLDPTKRRKSIPVGQRSEFLLAS